MYPAALQVGYNYKVNKEKTEKNIFGSKIVDWN